MRRLLLLSAVLVAVACSDNQQPTAPANSRSLSPDGAAAAQLAPSGQGKTTSPIGFTKVAEVLGPIAYVAAGAAGASSAACPAGTVVVGGTHRFNFADASTTPPWIWQNDTDGQNGWRVVMENKHPDAFQLSFRAIAYCAS
jgi:hypothetical protein